MFPSEILLQIFRHLPQTTLSNLRQVSKEWYFLVTPILLTSHHITLIDLTNLNEYHQGRCRGHDDDIAIRCFFESSPEGRIARKLYDLSFVQEMKITYGPSSHEPCCLFKDNSINGNWGRFDHSLNFQPLLSRLNTIGFTYQALRHLYASSVTRASFPPPSQTDLHLINKVLSIMSCLKQCFPVMLILEYPSIILEKEDLDLSSNFAHFLRNLIDQIPSLREIRYDNLHLQPISLPPPNSVLRNVVMVFSRHSKCPDMGGTIHHYRKKQIMDSLKELIDDESKRFDQGAIGARLGGEERVEGTRYVFEDSIGSIPQWCSHVDIREQAKCLEDEIKSGLVKLYSSIPDQRLGEGMTVELVDEFSLVEDGNGMNK